MTVEPDLSTSMTAAVVAMYFVKSARTSALQQVVLMIFAIHVLFTRSPEARVLPIVVPVAPSKYASPRI